MASTKVSNSPSSSNPDIPVATDEVSGAQFQKVKLALGGDGVDAGTVSLSNPLPITAASALIVDPTGEVVEALESIRMQLHSLLRTVGQSYPDTAGRLRIVVDAINSSVSLSTVSTVNTVSTVTNQSQVGGFIANEQMPSLMRIACDSLRRNIVIS